MSESILDVRGIVKTFPGVRALDGVDLKVRKGEVHAIVGENGAGKSTLMLTLGGIHKPDEGEIFIEGRKVQFESAHDANRSGVSVVYQELSLAQSLTVAENVFANRQPVGKLGFIDKKLLYEQTAKMLSLFRAEHIKPDTLVKDLSLANQQVVEILKAMSLDPKILILDEPTSSLMETEIKQLFENIRILKDRGIACLYISHHLNEIFEIADTVTVLRDGAYICDAVVSDIDVDFLITNMVGRKIENIYGKREERPADAPKAFEAEGLTLKGAFHDISFHINKGEIVGFAGLVGAGRTELGRSIFGSEPPDSGTMTLDGKKLSPRTPHQAIENRIGYMTEDRKKFGLYLKFDITSNLMANRIKDFSTNGFVSDKEAEINAGKVVGDLGIVTPGINQLLVNLSGGNQQKVLLGAWLGIEPKLLIVDEPTRGVDVGAKSEIYELLRGLARNGVAIMMISSDLPEILGVSDRIVVMKDGGIVGVLDHSEATEDKVIALATGAGKKGE